MPCDKLREFESQRSALGDPLSNIRNELIDFGKGFITGAIKETADVIEFMATPNAVNRALADAATFARQAVNYYAESPLPKVAQDAEVAISTAAEFLREYGTKSPGERGEICGGIATQFVVIESISKASKLALRATDEFFEPIALTSGDASELTARVSPEFIKRLNETLSSLPEHYRDFLKKRHVQVIPVSDMAEVEPTMEYASGLFTTRNGKPCIYVAESAHRLSNGYMTPHMELTLHHEITHAIDYAYSRHGGWLSDKPIVARVFDDEFKSLSDYEQNNLLIRIGRGKESIVRKEVVAELVSRHNVPNVDGMDDYFRSRFPRLNQLLNSPKSPFSSEFQK